MTDLVDFLALLRAARVARLAALDVGFDRALKDEDVARLREILAERRRLLDLPSSIVDGPRADLLAQWPADFPVLPQWFVAPETVDTPGKPQVIDCSPSPTPPIDAVSPDLEAAILARRAERAPADDIARGTALERKSAIDARLAGLIEAEQTRKGG
jgi:hypothetical protein